VANLADEIAYYSHDIDDGLTAGLFSEAQLARDVRIWREAGQAVRKSYGELPDECRRYFVIRCIIDDEVKDVVCTTEERIRASGASSSDDVRLQSKSRAQYSGKRRKLNLGLRD